MAQHRKVRNIILTAAVAGVTVTGAWYGAGLKYQQDRKQGKEVYREATPAELIAQLETARGRLVTRKLELERKLSNLEAKMATKAAQRDGQS